MTEGGEAAVREQKMEARRIEHEDEHFRRDAKEIIARDERQKRRDRQGENDEQPALRAEWAPAGKDRAARAPRGRFRAAEQSPGPHDQHDRHHQEDEDDRNLREDEDTEGVELGDDDRREEGALHAAEPADHDDNQRFRDHLHVHRVAGGLARQFERAAEAREKDAEREDAGEEPFLVDAERRHHFAILSRGAHQHAPGRAVEDDQMQARTSGASAISRRS